MSNQQPCTLEFWRSRLPHWEVVGGIYFITIQLAGSVPKSAAARILANSQEAADRQCANWQLLPWIKIHNELERWIDLNSNTDALTQVEIAEFTMESIEYRKNNGIWAVYEFVIMPNHLHILLGEVSGSLHKSIESFKMRIGRFALKFQHSKTHRFWQREWFDHWIRSPEEFEGIRDYIRQNPVRAGLVSNWWDWRYGSWSKR